MGSLYKRNGNERYLPGFAMIKKALFGAVIFLNLIFFTAAKADFSPRPEFKATVIKVTEYGAIRFDNRRSARIWGIIPDPDRLRDLVLNQELLCTDWGSYAVHRRGGTLVTCEIMTGDYAESGDLAKLLLRLGYAEEFCLETRNYLSHCGASK